ncbi:MAG: flavin-nucleotide-binding protein, partial [Gammaproteobacteria bacterium]|nr:flavin-nucleotide-binding protein [Gammaproteobacteria bacterium]
MTDHDSPFHRGEREIQSRLGIRDKIEPMGRRMIRSQMPAEHSEFLTQIPLLVVGAADAANRPWASVLVGTPGFVHAIDSRTLAVKARPVYGDPLNQALVDGADVGALGLEFSTRRRNRVNGKLTHVGDDGFQIHVTQSFGNCPKYIQTRELRLDRVETVGEKRPVHRRSTLTKAEATMIAGSDTFFIASQLSEDSQDWTHGIDVSHRGGLPGFVIVAHETSLLFPDYSGNC